MADGGIKEPEKSLIANIVKDHLIGRSIQKTRKMDRTLSTLF